MTEAMITRTDPLWVVLDDAMDAALVSGVSTKSSALIRAAELRAIASWLEAKWTAPGPTPNALGDPFIKSSQMGEVFHREATLNVLRSEAERAARGEK
jgi:hypothetical protein